MLDFRHETFLELCKMKNYTKTAEALHITQPAVSQHIKFLETYYDKKLFHYESKTLNLTEQGKLLQEFALTVRADSERVRNLLSMQEPTAYPVKFGATLTIGEYIMPPILMETMKVYPNIHITMSVNNTEVLLKKLRDGEIDFALVEGFFKKEDYGVKVFSKEEFIPVCSIKSSLAQKEADITKLLKQRLILREKGSGTREIFERLLWEHNLTTDNFENVCDIGSISAIKELVEEDAGITFLYRAGAEKELAEKKLAEIKIQGFATIREFNFVYLKNSIHEKDYLKWCEYFVEVYSAKCYNKSKNNCNYSELNKQ